MNELKESLFRKMLLIRKTEQAIDALFSMGLLRGTVHGCIGQESIAVGLLSHLDPKVDYITGNHRSHGHYLALCGEPEGLLGELMGKRIGAVEGRGGSQHIRYKNFFTNGITGGMVPIAVGLAFAQKKRGHGGIVVAFFGDGAMNEGYVMEAFNLASVLQLPILFALENNGFAMSTDQKTTTAGNFESRIKAFGIEYHFDQATNAIETYQKCGQLVEKVRRKGTPLFAEFQTHRFSGHSKSDPREYISEELDAYWRTNDPLARLGKEIDPGKKSQIELEVEKRIEDAKIRSMQSPFPNPENEYEGEEK